MYVKQFICEWKSRAICFLSWSRFNLPIIQAPQKGVRAHGAIWADPIVPTLESGCAKMWPNIGQFQAQARWLRLRYMCFANQSLLSTVFPAHADNLLCRQCRKVCTDDHTQPRGLPRLQAWVKTFFCGSAEVLTRFLAQRPRYFALLSDPRQMVHTWQSKAKASCSIM